jgi:hypothetical protein
MFSRGRRAHLCTQLVVDPRVPKCYASCLRDHQLWRLRLLNGGLIAGEPGQAGRGRHYRVHFCPTLIDGPRVPSANDPVRKRPSVCEHRPHIVRRHGACEC